MGRSGQVAQLAADLDAERATLTTARPAAGGEIDLDAWRPLIEARVREMRDAFDGEHDARRGAFRALLGDRRMRVLPDPGRLFRVEGLFELVLETADARNHEDSGRLHSQVAGVGFEPTTSGL